MKTLRDLKQFLKDTAIQIKVNKPIIRGWDDFSSKEKLQTYWELHSKVNAARRSFRHHLIAYCELRGMRRERVERPASNNLPNEDAIKKVKEEYLPTWREEHEDVHTCQG